MFFLILPLLFLMSCANSLQVQRDKSIKQPIPDRLQSRMNESRNESLLVFTELIFNDSIVITQKNRNLLNQRILTDEVIGVAKIVTIPPKNTTIRFMDRNYKIKLRKKDLENYNYVYISSLPKIDTVLILTLKEMMKANYLIEFTNDIRYFR